MRVHLLRLAALISLPLLSFAQLDTAGRNPDELFEYARQLAAKGRYADARTVSGILLRRAPEYHDAVILTARTHAWQRQYDSARVLLHGLLRSAPTTLDAHHALTDIELWAQRYDAAVRAADDGLKLFPQNEELLIRKARALHLNGNDESAQSILRPLADAKPNDPSIRVLLQEIQSRPTDHRIGLTYSGDFFTQYYGPMHTLEGAYEYRTRLGPVIGHLSAAERFGQQGVQFGVEWYPRITRDWSGYIAYAFSGSVLFPDHRVGLEASVSVADQWEASFGGRAFVFNDEAPVWLGTLSATMYSGTWLISLRPYLTVRREESALSGVLSVRYHYGGEAEYLFGRIGTGFSADERLIQTSEGFAGKDLFFLESQFAGIGAQVPLSASVDARVGMDYTRRELGFLSGEYVSMFTATAGISYHW